MESDPTSHQTTKWRSLYEAAIMELDGRKFLELLLKQSTPSWAVWRI